MPIGVLSSYFEKYVIFAEDKLHSQFESKLSLRSFALSLQTIYSKNLQKHAQ